MNATELAWFKSSYSSADGDDCVEIAWSQSSHSGTQGDNCVEVSTHPAHVHVRDSKAPARPHLTLSPGAWSRFLSEL
jgi:hypothetical protein